MTKPTRGRRTPADKRYTNHPSPANRGVFFCAARVKHGLYPPIAEMTCSRFHTPMTRG